MNLLTAFHYVFTSDTKDVAKNVDEAEKKAEGLTKQIKESDLAAKALTESFKGMLTGALAAAASAVAVGAIISRAKEAAEFANELGKASRELKVNAAELDAWQSAAGRMGGSAEGVRGAIKSINEGVMDFKRTGGGDFAFILNAIGVRMRDTAGKIKEPLALLPELAAKFQKMKDFRQLDVGRKLGFDEGTIRMLSKGRDAVEEYVKRQQMLGTVTEKDTQIAQEFENQMDDTSRVFRRLSMDSAQTIIPMLTWLYKKFEDVGMWVRGNKELVTGFFVGAAYVITAAFLPSILSALAASIAFLAPWLLIGAAVAAVVGAIALVYEDVVIFLNGGESLLGKMIAKWPALGEAIRDVANLAVFLWDTFKAYFGALISLVTGDGTAAFDQFVSAVSAALDKLAERWPNLAAGIRIFGEAAATVGRAVYTVWSTVWDILSAIIGGIGKAIDFMSNAGGKIRDFFGGGDTKKTLEVSNQQMGLVAGNPLSSVSSGAINNFKNMRASKETKVDIGSVTVQTQATDSDGIAAQIGTSLQSQIAQTNNQFDDGVRM